MAHGTVKFYVCSDPAQHLSSAAGLMCFIKDTQIYDHIHFIYVII